MSGNTTIRMINAYNQMASPTLYMAGMFQSPPVNFHDTEEVEIDVTRSEEEVSVAIQDLSTGYRYNSADIYTNKNFKPPIFKEAVAINSWDLLKREAGDTPFESPGFRSKLTVRIFNAMVKVEAKIKRAIELQASQVLQTGTATLIDSAGEDVYAIDYKPKATHFPTVANTWGGGSDTPIADLAALCEVIRTDGLIDPDFMVMGITAFNNFIENTDVLTRFDNRRIDMGRIAPAASVGQGASYRGAVDIGHYKLDVYTYAGRYKAVDSGTVTQFMDPTKVLIRASGGRLDATFGAIPNIGALLNGGGGLIPELPGRISNVAGGMDLFANAWLSADGDQLFAGYGSRPLYIPTAIDTFGCLDTTV